ncbi:hypothetical protein ACFSSA_11045 [Luteolibacter algae]|uniref:Tetratricopeptide repeat protein n=1 Tax=Luteolibacter algae TaxID=454151 RepID=A0ABW5D838_9BACT
MKASFLRILAVFVLLAAVGHAAEVRTRLASTFLARGEKSLLEVRVEQDEPDEMPRIPQVKDVVIESLGFATPRMLPGRRLEYVFQYIVSSYAIGEHEIAPFEVVVDGVRSKTEPIKFSVFDPNDLKWGEAVGKPREAQEAVRYASVIKVGDSKVFENQTIPAEIKIYIPRELSRYIQDWGVPEYDRKNLAVWRFEPSEIRGEVNLLGQPYISLSYPTTMTPLSAGEVEIGPATVRITYAKMVFDQFAQRLDVQATLDIPKHTFEAAPLPNGAPEGFDNAVGKFMLGTAIKDTEVTEGEPLALDVIVTGSGNLDNLRSPKLIDPEGWKIYDATPNQRGDERRNLDGTVVFSQFIRPLEMKTAIPPFRLVYFDPEKEKYETVTTEPISINMTPATGGRNFETSGPPQALPMPVERMTDILGLIDTKTLLVDSNTGKIGIIAKVIGVLVAVALMLRALWLRFGHLLERDEEKIEMRKDLQDVEKLRSADGVTFLKRAGAFIEKWFPREEDEELARILRERDQLCYRATKQETDLSKARRGEILKNLKKAAFGFMLLIIFGATSGHANGKDIHTAAKTAYEEAKYEEAAKKWLDAGPYEQLSADTLYNIGNAAYRMGEPGQAALYYRRALLRERNHTESLQNLRFIERKYGAITVKRPSYQYSLAKIELSTWKGILWSGGWLLVVGLLIFPATRAGSRWRVVGVIAFVLGPLLMSLGSLGWRYYPDDAEFAAAERQAVVVRKGTALHTDASRTSTEVIDAPQGSLAEVIERSGRWVYIGFATKTRGWVPAESIEMVVPDSKPEAPKVRKSTADGSSA